MRWAERLGEERGEEEEKEEERRLGEERKGEEGEGGEGEGCSISPAGLPCCRGGGSFPRTPPHFSRA